MSNVPPASLALQRLYHWETTAPTRVALTQPMGGAAVQDFTWAQVGEQVRRMAAYLQAQGWEPGSRVAILSKNCAWWLMSDLAIWMAGYVSVPLYPTLAHDTVRQILTHSEAKACFIGKLDGWEGMKPGVPEGMPCISYPLSPADAIKNYKGWDAICAGTQPLQGQPTRGADELATLIYTSGTTGMPKGVMHTFGNFAWALGAGIQRIAMNEQDRMLSYLPLAHVVERVLVEHGWLRTGMHVYFAESLDTFAADLQRARPTIFFSVPRLWVKFQQGIHHKMPEQKLQRLLSLPLIGGLVRRKVQKALGLDQCRVAAGGAAPMPLALLEWYSRLGLHINEGYGMTENLAVSHLTIPGKNQQGSVGPVYDGVEHRIDPQTGEVQMRSPALMLGYYKEPELSSATFTADGWLKTGDKGRIDTQGCLHITGRVKDLFKTAKGKYVAPAPIENMINAHPMVELTLVSGVGQVAAYAMVVLAEDLRPKVKDPAVKSKVESELTQLLKDVNKQLADYEKLQMIVVAPEPWSVENGYLTPTMKIRRARIEAAVEPQLDSWYGKKGAVHWV